MAFFGVVVAGVIVGRVVHSNYSVHSNYRDYSDYAERQRIIEENLRRERESNRKRYQEYAERELKRLEEEFSCNLTENKNLTNYNAKDCMISTVKESFKKNIEEKINQEIAEDKQELDKINKLISKINNIQLTKQERK